jgi:hypothetical protein
MKIIVKIKDVTVEISDTSDRTIYHSEKEIKALINEVFDNYKKLDL